MTTEISQTLSVSFDDDEPTDCIIKLHDLEFVMTEKQAVLLANTIMNQYYGL